MAELGNPKNTIEVLQKYQFHFAKKFGQNFLIDTHVLDKIVRAAEITPEDYVLEIGPGIGTMTQYLAENQNHPSSVAGCKSMLAKSDVMYVRLPISYIFIYTGSLK